jgi:hypothetical protein
VATWWPIIFLMEQVVIGLGRNPSRLWLRGVLAVGKGGGRIIAQTCSSET